MEERINEGGAVTEIDYVNTVREILASTLQLGDKAADLDRETRLFGNIAELDSMAVVTVLTEIEEYYGFDIDDDEVSAETFETLGSLASFVESKCV